MSRVQKMVKSNPLVLKNATTVNDEGYAAFVHSPKEAYLKLLLTNTCGNTFYESAEEQALQSGELHEKMVKSEPEYVAKALVFARNEGFMRLQPVFGLAYLAYAEDKTWFKKAFDQVIKTPADLFDFFSLMKMIHGTEGSTRIKKVVASWLSENLSEYWAVKYNGRGRGYNLTDVIRLTHPIPIRITVANLFQYLTTKKGKEADVSHLPMIQTLLALKENKFTEVEVIELIKNANLYYEAVTSAIKPTSAVWKALMYTMPTFALLRHLVTLERNDAIDVEYIRSRFNAQAIHKSKILPFRFVLAFEALRLDSPLKDVLRLAVEESVANIPEVPGKTAVFLDISGSMNGDNLRSGALYALSLMKRSTSDSLMWLFNTQVYSFIFSKVDSILTQAYKIQSDGGTDVGEPFRKLNESNQIVDQIVVITDEQQNTGSHAMREYDAYKRRLNPNVKLFVVNVGQYAHTIFDPKTYDKDTHFIYGFSDSAVKYISMMIEGMHSLSGKVEEVQF